MGRQRKERRGEGGGGGTHSATAKYQRSLVFAFKKAPGPTWHAGVFVPQVTDTAPHATSRAPGEAKSGVVSTLKPLRLVPE